VFPSLQNRFFFRVRHPRITRNPNPQSLNRGAILRQGRRRMNCAWSCCLTRERDAGGCSVSPQGEHSTPIACGIPSRGSMRCKGAGLIDVGVSTWRERRKGQKRKRVKREGRGRGEKEGDKKRGVGASKGEGRDGRWGRGIGKRNGKGSAEVGEGTHSELRYPSLNFISQVL